MDTEYFSRIILGEIFDEIESKPLLFVSHTTVPGQGRPYSTVKNTLNVDFSVNEKINKIEP